MPEENQKINETQSYSKNPMMDLDPNKSYAAIRRAVTDGFSDALAKQNNPRKVSQSVFQDKQKGMTYSRNGRYKTGDYRRTGNILDDIEQGIRDELLDSLAGGDFKKGMKAALSEFTKKFGFELRDLPHEYGKYLGKQLADSKLGKSFQDSFSKAATKWINNVFGSNSGTAMMSAFKSGSSSGMAGKQIAAGSLSQATASKELFSGISKYAGSAASVAAVAAVAYALLKPLLGGITDVIKAWGRAFNRDEDIRKKRLENSQKRIEQDMEYLAKEPFEILKKAANEWAQTWDSNLSKVALTQGYTKEDVYSLYENISGRLINEGLGSVIPATDVVNKLSSILETGLSGRVAEEFAYQSAKLNAAIPTENFTGYASTYAQLASYAISQGKSQAEALEYANTQLQLFASNLLYSSRNLSGGFTTGLKDAQALFKEAVDIAQSARTGNVAQISGTLTAVSGVIGSVAPDLAQGLVQNIVNAAIGGNESSTVALRSLAGINAGNTAFLQALAEDPQGVFVNLFRNLANMQTMSPSNYMEVAEGLASVFGIDMKAFARVDFNQLANSIANISAAYSRGGTATALAENMNLLKSGEATTSAEQLKLQEINNAILEEGLAYIIDSEAGRMIQEHMWEEQIANQLAENEYAVTLQGAALTYLEGLRHAVANILNFLNPLGYLAKGVANMAITKKESEAANQDIAAILERGAIGSNSKAFSNLLTVGQDLGLTRPLIELMGGTNRNRAAFREYMQNVVDDATYKGAQAGPFSYILYNLFGTEFGSGAAWNDAVDKAGGMASNFQLINDLGATTRGYQTNFANISTYNSKYSGFSVGKSILGLTAGTANGLLPAAIRNSPSMATANALAESNARLEQYLANVSAAAEEMSADQYIAKARDYGIADLPQALEDAGHSMEEFRAYFEANEALHGASAEQARKDDEQAFRDETRKFWDFTSGSSGIFQTTMWLPFLNDDFRPFFSSGARYDQRMDLIDSALVSVQAKEDIISDKLGDASKFTVISVLESINSNLISTFVQSNSTFQKCLADWMRYIAATKEYKSEVSNAQSWSDLKRAEGDKQNETLLALAQAMNVFSADELKKLDPQMQANALLGKIVIILEAMMQQQNTQAGGLSLLDTMSALGLGITQRTNI